MAQPDEATLPDQVGREPEADEAAVGRGLGAPNSAHLEEDRYIGVRVNYTYKPTGPLAPIQDVRVAPEEPSVWEARSESEG